METLIGIGQYESARLQLRQGPASTIRLELRQFEQDTWPGDPQVVHCAQVFDSSNRKD